MLQFHQKLPMLQSSHPNRSDLVSLIIFDIYLIYMLIFIAASTPHLHTKEPATDWHPPDFREFVPGQFGGPMVCAPFISLILICRP